MIVFRPPLSPWGEGSGMGRKPRRHLSPLSNGSGRRMEIKRGTAVSPGVAIGPALVLDSEGFRIPQRFVPANQVEAEVERLRVALAAAAGEARPAKTSSPFASANSTAPSSVLTPFFSPTRPCARKSKP